MDINNKIDLENLNFDICKTIQIKNNGTKKITYLGDIIDALNIE